MSRSANPERGLDVEDVACQRWPASPVSEDRDEWCDLVIDEDLDVERSAEPVATAGTAVEVKSCYARYESRAGRWWIARENHDRLLEVDGEYALGVVDEESEDVLRLGLLSARTVDAIIDGEWWHCGEGGQHVEEFRQIAWTDVFRSLDEPGGDAR